MFGQPQWFRPKKIGWGLSPICWQGWVYTVGWVSAIGLPFLVLTERHQPFEAAAWGTLGCLSLYYDIWKIRRAMNLGPARVMCGRDNHVV
jgi:hypothetical protein